MLHARYLGSVVGLPQGSSRAIFEIRKTKPTARMAESGRLAMPDQPAMCGVKSQNKPNPAKMAVDRRGSHDGVDLWLDYQAHPSRSS
jgi:hypothetical protein